MKKATDGLLSDHKMIRKLLDGFEIDNPRYPQISKTLERVVLMHAWFEDTIFLPAFRKEPLIAKRYLDQLYQEHQDIDYFLALIVDEKKTTAKERAANIRQFRAILETHLTKEEEALFPLATSILDSEGLDRISSEMENRQIEARDLFLNVKRP